MSNWFDENVRKNHNPADIRASIAQNFEVKTVEYLLQRLKLAQHRSDILKVSERLCGTRVLTLQAFNEHFPTFPFLLRATLPKTPIHRDQLCTEPARFRSFRDIPFVQSWAGFYEALGSMVDTKKVALVIHRKGLIRGLVMHNDDSEQFWSKGLAWVYKYKSQAGDTRLYVHPFSDLVEGIYANGRGWRPLD